MKRVPKIPTLRRRLQWSLIEEQVHPEHEAVTLLIQPNQAGLDPIYLPLSLDRTFQNYVGFREWHYHPDDWKDALETIRQLIHGEICLVEELNRGGKYLGGGLYGPDETPDTLGLNIKSLRRVFFNRDPMAEEIDFSRYFRGKHLWVEKDHKRRTEQMWRQLGMREFEF